jgi:hypothetical protein
MVTQTYILKDLPKAIINDDNDRGLRFIRGIEKDIHSELGEFLNTRWTPTGEREMVLTVDVSEDQIETLKCLMHNLHSAKLIQTT